ncbi:hypothetical protein BDZ94DRAFT_1312771 [Collybia nuda]|uniref:Fungal-type protein kinase domain-containing protein n=1 Tax=Collybia nuda TaxID=64659 RepID=A0A9P5XYT6_9AGAR|nr:hypothetical protein BDZ94DRAFT_1312771 [Collybia nuda]
MALFAVLPVTQPTDSPHHSNSLFHQSRSPSQSPDKNELEHSSSTMAGNSSRRRPTKTTPVTPVTPAPSRPAISAAALNGTPQNLGSGSRSLYGVYDDPKKAVVRKQYDAYLHEDLLNHRVYISFESALQNILHVPNDWKEDEHEYRKIINQVAKNDGFQKKREAYLNLCNGNEAGEEALYEPQTQLYNEAISLINSFSASPYHKKDESLLHFRVNHPIRIAEGIFTAKKGLVPDLTGTLKQLNQDEYIIWPMIVHVEEMKDSDATLDKGDNVPRAAGQGRFLLCEGDPWSERHSPARKRTAGTTEETTQAPDKKRKISSAQSVPSKAARVSRQKSASARPDEQSATSTADPERKDNEASTEARLQCARYLMEMLEFSVLRSHALVTLVDRDRMQLVYADRSAIVTSSIIDLRTDNGLDQFLAMLIAFHRLSPKQWGFLSLVENPFLTNSYKSSSYSTSTTEDKKRKWLHAGRHPISPARDHWPRDLCHRRQM